MGSRITRRASVEWRGDVESGAGTIALGSKAFEGPYSLRSRVEDVPQANPEELIGAANAACFTMSLSDLLSSQGTAPTSLDTKARVTMEEESGRYSITRIELDVVGEVPGCDSETFDRLAAQAEATCPVSRALAGTEIVLTSRLVSEGTR
jgi:osmotically inducible protein OsmC